MQTCQPFIVLRYVKCDSALVICICIWITKFCTAGLQIDIYEIGLDKNMVGFHQNKSVKQRIFIKANHFHQRACFMFSYDSFFLRVSNHLRPHSDLPETSSSLHKGNFLLFSKLLFSILSLCSENLCYCYP